MPHQNELMPRKDECLGYCYNDCFCRGLNISCIYESWFSTKSSKQVRLPLLCVKFTFPVHGVLFSEWYSTKCWHHMYIDRLGYSVSYPQTGRERLLYILLLSFNTALLTSEWTIKLRKMTKYMIKDWLRGNFSQTSKTEFVFPLFPSSDSPISTPFPSCQPWQAHRPFPLVSHCLWIWVTWQVMKNGKFVVEVEQRTGIKSTTAPLFVPLPNEP